MVCTLTDADSLEESAGPPPAKADRFHFDLGMAVPFTVKTTTTAVMAPTDGTIVARDWSFEVPALAPGTRTLTFRNDGEQDHSLAVSEFADGIDAGAAKAAFGTLLAADADHPPPDDLPTADDVAFAGPLSAASHPQVGTVASVPSDSWTVTATINVVPVKSGPPRRRPPPAATAAIPTAPATRAWTPPPPAMRSTRAAPPSRATAGV